MTAAKKLLTTNEAAVLIGSSVATLATLRARKAGPAYFKQANGTILYDPRELTRYRESRKRIRRVETGGAS